MALTGLTNLQPLHVHSIGIGTFDNTVSVGGTLTYEDVTNVDAIGIITARSGINLTGGGINAGILDLKTGDNLRLRFSSGGTAQFRGDVDPIANFDRGSANSTNVKWGYLGADRGIISSISNEFRIAATSTIPMTFHSNGNERLRITSDGKLLVGNTSATNGSIAEFSKSVDSGAAGCHITVENTSNNSVNNTAGIHLKTSTGTAKFFKYQANQTFIQSAAGGASELILQASGAHPLRLYTNGNERLRINSNGAFGLGGATYGSSGQVLTSAGSGSVPTWSTVSGISVLNQADNRIITATGTTDELKGESNLTWDGAQLYMSCGNYSYPLVVNSVQSSVRAVIRQTNDANANSGLAIQKKHSTLHPANYWYGDISFEGWDGSGYHKASLIECVAEGTPANDNMPGGLRFSTNAGAAGVTERLRIKPDGNVEVKTGNLVMTSGKGIDFSADGSGTLKSLPNSFNAELLHDYENGTFTPNIQYDTGTNRYAGSNVSSATGEYIRIGDLVNFGMKITLTGNRNYSENIHLYIGGLPYNGMHSSQQSSMMTGWGGWACPTNDSNSSYKVHYCYHSYTTVNLRFSQSSGTGGISGFYVWGFYRTAP